MMHRDRQQAWMWVGLVLFVCISAIIVFEGGVRLRQFIKYGSVGRIEDFYVEDPVLKLRVLPANKAVLNIHVNSQGFRSPELVNPKPPATVRLAFLGASTTFCAEVSSDELTWPHLVSKRLQEARPGQSFDYVNAAAPGYTMSSLLKILNERVQSLAPDIIIIYEATNALAQDTRERAIAQGLIRQDELAHQSWLAKYSLCWFLIEKNWTIVQRQKEVTTRPRLTFEPAELSQHFRARLTELVRESQHVAKLVAVATFSYKLRREQTPEEQINAANTALYYMPYMSIEGLLQGYEEYNRVIREVAGETGALLITGELDIPGDDIHFNDSVHFKDAGSQRMAQRISDGLLKAKEFEAILQAKAGVKK